MAQRFALFSTSTDLAKEYNAQPVAGFDWKARYSIAPGSTVPVVLQPKPSATYLTELTWKGVITMEELLSSPDSKRQLQRQRCIIPANGFFEWQTIYETKIPFYVRLLRRPLFAFSGVYEVEFGENGAPVSGSVSILTTKVNAILEPVNTVMPLILRYKDIPGWLDPVHSDLEALDALNKPYASEEMAVYRVGNANNDENPEDSEALIAPKDV